MKQKLILGKENKQARNPMHDEALHDPHSIREVEYLGCNLGLRVLAVTYRDEEWYVITDGRQERWVRLFKREALKAMLKTYAYLDVVECLNVYDGTINRLRIHRGPRHIIRKPCLLDRIPKSLRAVRGVEQTTKDSGICWYAAMVFVMLFSAPMRKLFFTKADPALSKRMRGVLGDKVRAEELRRHLYYAYKLGDKPGQPPHLDGQNGFSQFCILLAKLDIPTIRLFAPTLVPIRDAIIDKGPKGKNRQKLRDVPRPDETSLLVVRCFHTRWIPRARIEYQVDPTRPPLRYRLIGLFIGSEYCSHQVAASATDTRSTTWALTDADATGLGIGPLFWTSRRRPGESRQEHILRWRAIWSQIVPATRFGNNQVCDLNPSNRPPRALERQAVGRDTTGRVGVVNTDFVYIHEPNTSPTPEWIYDSGTIYRDL